jgi:hypothetical protein
MFNACALSTSSSFTNSEFVYPNSNVKQISADKVTASKTKFCGILPMIKWSGFSQETRDATVAEAKSLAGADILINGTTSYTDTNYFLFSLCTTETTGYPAKMTVGESQLK